MAMLVTRILVLLALCSPSPLVEASIKIGMSAPLNMDQGVRFRDGMLFAFQEVNAAGGVMSQNISLMSLNDYYNVTLAMENLQRLVNEEQVLALAGVFGSDIVVPSRDLILQHEVPYVGAYAGIADLRTPFLKEYVNVRVSFSDEMVAQAIYLVRDRMVKRIACLYENDAFGIGGQAALVSALANVGITLVASGSYTKGTTDVENAVEAIAGASQKPQVVVFVALQDAIIRFINLFNGDPRVDSDCFYTAVSSGWGASFQTTLDPSLWFKLYFFFVVPPPDDVSSFTIARHFYAAYTAAGGNSGPTAFEGYIVGRLVAEVLKGIRDPNFTRALFLKQVYKDRLYILDDLVVGMYSGNWTNCDMVLCSCNTGLRDVHLAQLDRATGNLTHSLTSLRYSVLECSNPLSSVTAPLLFGQLLPQWDAGWRAVALEVGRGIAEAFAETNAGGGANGRNFVLLQQNSSTNATAAMETLSRRYSLVAFLGSVVLATLDLATILPTVGDLDIEPDAVDEPHDKTNLALQPTTSLELMGLAQYAVSKGCAIHLRAPTSGNGPAMLEVMVKSVHTLQRKPTSAALFTTASDVLSGASSGCVIALGSDADVEAWFDALPAYPALLLLTLSAPSMRLMALRPNASDYAQASQWHFPTIVTGNWNISVPSPAPSDAYIFGYVSAIAAVQAIQHSEYAANSYTTAAELVKAWYSVSLMTSGSLTFGPYYGSTCSSTDSTECECNAGARTVGVRSVASSDVESLYSISSCSVEYSPLVEADSPVVPAIVGSVVGAFALVVVLLLMYRFAGRNNKTAPKDSRVPFCVLFTDIQSSTHLWATIPDIMAPALDMHHVLIRKLIANHKCYEVKTIGDSFMCAAHTPQQGMQMALALQVAFHEHDWGSDAINAVYRENVPEDDVGRISCACWNGLRVRVGMHYGMGEVKFDKVSKGYDYYGTVVNTAARIESVCHGGQIGVSQAVYDALGGSWPGSVWSDLGMNELRGLSQPIRLYQVLPVGPFTKRRFPPLRIEHEDEKQEALETPLRDLGIVTHDPNSVKSPTLTANTSSSGPDDWRWLEAHPLVTRGDITTDDMRKYYSISLFTLSTLLNTQTTRFKETVLNGLCERLHVHNFGPEGDSLQRTLKGLVHRVLPATVMNARYELLNRHFSITSACQSGGDHTALHSVQVVCDGHHNKIAPMLEEAENP